MPRLAYWDQEEYDKAIHLIQQRRFLSLSLDFTANGVSLANQRVRVYVARSMVEGGDEYHDYLLGMDGKLEFMQQYDESLLDIELTKPSLPAGCGIDKITFHWFYPGSWVDQLKIKRDLGTWSAKVDKEQEGNVTIVVTYEPHLAPISASVAFTQLLGHTFEGPQMGSFPEASATIPNRGITHFTFHLRTFFNKWMKNYTTPYQIGDEFPIELTLAFDTPFDVKPSTQKDPEYVPKTYNGRVDHTDGNPFLGVPSTTPEHTTQITVQQKIVLTEAMLP
jgi:hypothetical protein